VVEVAPTRLRKPSRKLGSNLGVTRLATVVDTAGRRMDIDNPRHLTRNLRKLARLERQKARRKKGSSNRAKTRRRIAVHHGKIARSRLDYHHKQALTLIRDNQAVYVEDLNTAGLMKKPAAGAVHRGHAGWGLFVQGPGGEKQSVTCRTIHKVSPWLPSSKTCSSCGHRLSVMPLKIRTWTCPNCAIEHDRDFNAARKHPRRRTCGEVKRLWNPSKSSLLGGIR